MNYCLDMPFNIMNRSHIFYHLFLSSSDSLILFLNTKNLYLTRLPVRLQSIRSYSALTERKKQINQRQDKNNPHFPYSGPAV